MIKETSRIDKDYCMSAYLTFRYIPDENIDFFEDTRHFNFKPLPEDQLIKCASAKDIDDNIAKSMKEYVDSDTAIMLSGGMDSAILASYMPRGSKAYTMKCIAEGALDETIQARKYADAYGLDHEIVEIHWEDYLKNAPELMKHRGMPIHSIENQIYQVALRAKEDGIKKLIIGNSADVVFYGFDKLLAQDWSFNDFVKRYTFVDPAEVLKEPISMVHIFEPYRINETKIDFLKFINGIYMIESCGSYMNAFSLADMDYMDPYDKLIMKNPVDLNRIRNGEPKYLIRELFAMKYPDISIPNKIPMPRATDKWLANWEGPKRPEFLQLDISQFTGDQKWLMFCLELFLNLHDQGKL